MYTLIVEGGKDITKSGPYKSGTKISIEADAAPENELFSQWTEEDGSVFDDVNSMTTTFTMPANHAKVKATYTARN